MSSPKIPFTDPDTLFGSTQPVLTANRGLPDAGDDGLGERSMMINIICPLLLHFTNTQVSRIEYSPALVSLFPFEVASFV